MADPFLGQIMMFAGNFAPRGFAFCDGQLLAVSQNDALFSLLGTLYGGDGRTTFGLPDMRGRVPLHVGQGPGLSSRPLGSKGGSEEVALTANELPPHTHTVMGSTDPGGTTAPAGQVLANAGGVDTYSTAAADTTADGTSVGHSGGSQPHPNMMPFECINFCIALTGVYPSRQ